MKKMIIVLLTACLLLGCTALAELYDGPDYSIWLPDGSTYIESNDSLYIVYKSPDYDAGTGEGFSMQLTISCGRLSFECDTQTFLETYMEDYFKSGFMDGLNEVQYTDEDELVVIGNMSFIRSVYTYKEKQYCTYICLLADPAANDPAETSISGSLIYKFTSNADPESVEPILANFLVK